METIILVIHLVLVIAMVLVILVQRTSSDGLSGLSGGGANNALFSVRGKANILTKLTAILATGFIITSLTLAYIATHKTSKSVVDQISASQSKVSKEDFETKPAAPAADTTPAEPQVPVK